MPVRSAGGRHGDISRIDSLYFSGYLGPLPYGRRFSAFLTRRSFNMTFGRALTVLALTAAALPALGADANAGKAFFRAQCALCHSAEPDDNGGAQGPNLNGVLGRHSAAATGFS